MIVDHAGSRLHERVAYRGADKAETLLAAGVLAHAVGNVGPSPALPGSRPAGLTIGLTVDKSPDQGVKAAMRLDDGQSGARRLSRTDQIF